MASARTRATRRRRHADIRSQVRSAALALAERASFKDVTVEEIARAAGIPRSAFYTYFRDKHDLLMDATAEVGNELYAEADRWWHGDGEPEKLVREALEGVTTVYARHAGLLGITAEVSTYDEDVRYFWFGLLERFIEATAAHLERERIAGRLRPVQPRPAAESLCWMVERCCYVYLSKDDREPQALVEALVPIWVEALYRSD